MRPAQLRTAARVWSEVRKRAVEIRELGLQVHMIAHEIPGHTDSAEVKALAAFVLASSRGVTGFEE